MNDFTVAPANKEITVLFHGTPLTVITTEAGLRLVAMRPICDAIGLQWEAQLKRIRRTEVLNSTVSMMDMVAADGKSRQLLCLPLDYLNGWLFGIEVNRAKPEIRERLKEYQRECYQALHAYWNDGMAINPRTAYAVNPGDKLTAEEAETLRLMLKSAVDRQPKEKQGALMIQGWSKLKAHFKVGYREIPRHEFSEAVSIIARHAADWELVDAPQQAQPAIDPFNAQAMAAASKQANEYFDAARQGKYLQQPTAFPPEVLCGLLAQAMLQQRFMLSFDRCTGRMNFNPVPDDAYVLSWQQFARAVVTNDIDPSNTELAELASACNRRLAQRLTA